MTEDTTTAKKVKGREYARKWRLNNPEKARERNRRWRLKNPDKIKEKMLAWRAKNPDYDWKREGLPMPTRPMPALCECCGKPPQRRVLSLDHCHKTGKFRGFLCERCNLGIGQLGDNEFGVMQAAMYLGRNA